MAPMQISSELAPSPQICMHALSFPSRNDVRHIQGMIAGIFNRHSCLRCVESTVSSQQRLRLNKVSRRWQVLRASGPLREFQEQASIPLEFVKPYLGMVSSQKKMMSHAVLELWHRAFIARLQELASVEGIGEEDLQSIR